MENKLKLIIVVLFSLSIGYSSAFSTGNECKVGMERIDEHHNEFFVIYGNDTSDCSYIFRKTEKDEIVIETYPNSCSKLYQLMRARDVADTTAVEEFTTPCNYRHTNYNDMIIELDLCLSKASQVYDLSRLNHIYATLGKYDSIAIKVTQIINLSKFDKRMSILSRMEDAIKETDFSKDLNKVLKKYNNQVGCISCLEQMPSFRCKDVGQDKKTSNEMKTPKIILDAEIGIDIKQVQ